MSLPRFLALFAALELLCSSAIAGIVITGDLTLEQEGGTFAANDLAASGTAFAKDVLTGYAAHSIPHLNDLRYGNSNSWIAGSANSFAGINLGATAVSVNRMAFGRDNSGGIGDRCIDLYTLQYTTVANPDASTADSSWTTIGTLDYQSAGGANFANPHQRHVFSFSTVTATGLRLKTVADGTCIDEIEIYNLVVNGPNVVVQQPAGSNVADGGSLDFGSVNIGATTVKVFTVVNTGTVNLTRLALTKTGSNAADFTIGALGKTTLAPAESTTFSVTFKANLAGAASASLRLASNVVGSKNPYDITLTGNGLCPAITVTAPSITSATVGMAFSQNFTQSGGQGAVTFTTRDPLPPGISLSAAGVLSGNATVMGRYPLVVIGTDSKGCIGLSAHYVLNVMHGAGAELVVEQPASTPRADGGAVVTWGFNASGSRDVPAGLVGVKALSGSIETGHNLALIQDGSVVAWGRNDYGQATVPDGLANVVKVSAGSYASVALKSNGTLQAWGWDESNSLAVGSLTDVVDVCAVRSGGLALRRDGKVVVWGAAPVAPASLANVVAISGGAYHYLALLANGKVVGWGRNDYGQATPPIDLANVQSVSVGMYHSMALLKDGTVRGWGWNASGELNVPAGTAPVKAISAGGGFTVALKTNGSVVAWGGNFVGQTNVPSGLDNVQSIAAGAAWGCAVVAAKPTLALGDHVAAMTSIPVTVTLRNPGSAALTISAITKDGANAADFILTQPALTSIPAAGSTTFTVAVQPSALGARVAALRFTSNDPLRPAFDMNLSAKGVCPTITVTPPAETSANTVEAFNQSFTQAGVIGTPTFTATGTLPPGLTLSSIGVLSGKATTAGDYSFTVTATGTLGCSGTSASYTLNVVRPPTIDVAVVETPATTLPIEPSTSLPEAAQGTAVTGSPTASKSYTITNNDAAQITLSAFRMDGDAAADFSVSEPASTTLASNASTTFTVTMTPSRAGVRRAVLHIAGSDGSNLTSPFDVLLSGSGTCPSISIIKPTVTTATAGVAFSQSFSQSGGLGTITYSLEFGTLPLGLTLNTNGTLAGTPLRSGSFPIVVRATDIHLCTGVSSLYTLVVAHGAGPQLVVEQPAATVLATSSKVIAFYPPGRNSEGVLEAVPADLGNVQALAAGEVHGLALRSDGTVIAWGDNSGGQATVPTGLTNVIAIDAGPRYSLALKADGTVVAWGVIYDDASEDDLPIQVPAGLANVAAISAGRDHVLVAKTDGSVVAWGDNRFDKATVPVGLSNVIAVAAGNHFSLALKSDGTVVAWGAGEGRLLAATASLSNVQAISAKSSHFLALLTDGTVFGWSVKDDSEADVPLGLNGVKSIVASESISFALKHDGSLVTWGDNEGFPEPLTGIQTLASGFRSIIMKLAPVVAFAPQHASQLSAPSLVTLRNAGDAPLTLAPLSVAPMSLGGEEDRSGAENSDFLLTQPAVTTLAPGASTTCSIAFLPLGLGGRFARLTLPSNDPAAPLIEITLQGSGLESIARAQLPSILTATVGQFYDQSFIINGMLGSAWWVLAGSDNVPGMGFDSRAGRFSGVPTVAGSYPMTAYASHDAGSANSPSFTFVVVNAPTSRLVVSDPADIYALSDSNFFNLGSSQVGVGTSPHVFTLSNVGNASALLGSTAITISGANSADFTLVNMPTGSSLAAGASSSFSIVFKPNAVGERTAMLNVPGSNLSILIKGTGSSTPVTTPTPQPLPASLGLQYPIGDAYTHGSRFDLGSLGLKLAKTYRFTLTNSGDLPLTGISASIAGTNAADFKILAAAPSSITAGSSASMVMQVKLSSLGAKSAQLRIASSDPRKPVFELDLAATAVAVSLPVVTTLSATGIGPTTTLNGTVDPKGLTRDIYFDLGTSTAYGRSYNIAIVGGTALQPIVFPLSGFTPHATYHFRIRAESGQGSANGANRTFVIPNRAPVANTDSVTAARNATVTIDALANDSDADNDRLTITRNTAVTPTTAGRVTIVANKLVFTASSTFTSGTATFGYSLKDGYGGIASSTVTVTASTCSVAPTTLTQPSAAAVYNLDITAGGAWSISENFSWLSVSPASGFGDTTVQVSIAANASTAARNATLTICGQTHALTQSGVIVPTISTLGSTPIQALVSAPFSLDIPVVNPPVTLSGSNLPPGLRLDSNTLKLRGTPTTAGNYNITIRAKNAAGPAANNSAAVAAASVSFTVQVSDLDTNLIGSYQGLVSRNAVAFISPNGNLGTRVQLITTKSGGVTGQLLEGTTKLSLKGQLTADVMDPTHPRLIINTTAATTKLPVTLDVTFDAASNSLAGDFRLNGNLRATAAVQGWRNIWRATNPATSYAAAYSATLHYAGPPSALIPSADANASFTIAPTTGNLTIISTLTDGSKVTCATFVGPAGQVLFYQALYNNRGSITGRLDLTLGSPAPSNNTLLGDLTWLRPAALPASKDPLYRAGFGPIELDVTGDTP